MGTGMDTEAEKTRYLEFRIGAKGWVELGWLVGGWVGGWTG